MQKEEKTARRARIGAPAAAAIGAGAGIALASTARGLTGLEVIALGGSLGAIFGLAAHGYYRKMTER